MKANIFLSILLIKRTGSIVMSRITANRHDNTLITKLHS